MASALCHKAFGGVPYGATNGAAGALKWSRRGSRPAPQGPSMELQKYGDASRERSGPQRVWEAACGLCSAGS
eukprot:9498386-Pyramimonas_sp.AAC.1